MNLRNLCKTSMRQANVCLSTGSPDLFFFFFNSFHSHIYFGLCWVLIAAQALLQLWRACLSLQRLLLRWTAGSGSAGFSS